MPWEGRGRRERKRGRKEGRQAGRQTSRKVNKKVEELESGTLRTGARRREGCGALLGRGLQLGNVEPGR